MGDRVYCCALEAEAAALDGAGLGTGMHAALRGAEQRDTLLTKASGLSRVLLRRTCDALVVEVPGCHHACWPILLPLRGRSRSIS